MNKHLYRFVSLGLGIVCVLIISVVRNNALQSQDDKQAVKTYVGSDILSDAADEVAGKLCRYANDKLLVRRSILSMDLAMKDVRNDGGDRIAVSILLLVPSKDFGENESNKLHDENMDFFFNKIVSRDVAKPVASVTVTVRNQSGKFESGSFVMVDNAP